MVSQLTLFPCKTKEKTWLKATPLPYLSPRLGNLNSIAATVTNHPTLGITILRTHQLISINLVCNIRVQKVNPMLPGISTTGMKNVILPTYELAHFTAMTFDLKRPHTPRLDVRLLGTWAGHPSYDHIFCGCKK